MVRVLVHVDFKSGRYVTPASKSLQLWAGALALAAKHEADAVRLGIYNARDGAFDWYPSATGYVLLDSPEAADAWSMVLLAAQLDDAPRPGPWCDPCWERRTKRCKHAQETP